MRVFIGYDQRQPVAYNVCRSSIERNASKSVDIQPLNIRHLPVQRKGLTEFSFSRYLVPFLCGYVGMAVFLDADMIVRGDIHELSLYSNDPVSVVKNKLRFEWPSMMVFNNDKCLKLTPEVVQTGKPFNLEWAESVGEIPSEWNFCVGYDKPEGNPKLIHYTQGIPCWPETKDCDYAKLWFEEHALMNGTVSWAELMGNSVHAQRMVA